MAIKYLDATYGTDTNAGTEALPWKTIDYAFSTIQDGDTLRIKDGAYIPSGVLNLGTKNIYVVVENADPESCYIDFGSQSGLHILLGVDNDSIFEYIGIKNALNTAVRTGALTITSGSPTVKGCKFSDCVSTGPEGGAAIGAIGATSIDCVDSRFERNIAGTIANSGHGIIRLYSAGLPKFRGCVFGGRVENKNTILGTEAHGDSGVIFFEGSCSPEITKSNFSHNLVTGFRTSPSVFVRGHGNFTMSECVVSNNLITEWGGGAILAHDHSGAALISQTEVTNNVMTSALGGCAPLKFEKVKNILVSDCNIEANQSICTTAPSGNHASGGIYAYRFTNANIVRTKIIGNTCSAPSGAGGVLAHRGSIVTMNACAVVSNTASGGGAGAENAGGIGLRRFYLAAAWGASTAYSAGHRLAPGNGYTYRAEIDGVSGGTQPTWPVIADGTVIDGTVTWVCESLVDANGGAEDAPSSVVIHRVTMSQNSGGSVSGSANDIHVQDYCSVSGSNDIIVSASPTITTKTAALLDITRTLHSTLSDYIHGVGNLTSVSSPIASYLPDMVDQKGYSLTASGWMNVRVKVRPSKSEFFNNATLSTNKVRICVKAHDTKPTHMFVTKIGRSGSSGSFAEAPTTIKWGGVDDKTIPAASGLHYSDWIEFQINRGIDYTVHFTLKTTEDKNYFTGKNLYPSGWSTFRNTTTASDLSMELSPTLTAGSDHFLLADIQFANTPSPVFDVDGYTLTAASPCIDAGADPGFDYDITNGRVALAAHDIGAHEYMGAADSNYGAWTVSDGILPLSAQPCKSHALPIGVGKLTIFEGVASSAQIEESK